jgi:hypothetical protein
VSQEKRSNAYASGGNTVCLLDLLVAYMQRKKLQSPAYAYLTGTCYKSVQSVLPGLVSARDHVTGISRGKEK